LTHQPAADVTAALVDLLVRTAEAPLRDRLVLEASLAVAVSDAGALWRCAPAAAWFPAVERGRRGGRFESERATRRALENRVAGAPPGTSIVRTEVGGAGLALVLAGTLDAQAEDVLEALLTGVLLLELSAGDPAPGPVAPLPAARGESGRLQHDVRNALTSLVTTRQVLERFGTDLSVEERQRFGEALDRECERLGALLARGISGGQAPRLPPAAADELVADVLTLERASLGLVGMELRLLVDPAVRALTPGCGNEAWVRIVRNLIVNARAAAAQQRTLAGHRTASGTLDVRLVALDGADGPVLCLRLEDSAGGLPCVPLQRLFADGFTIGNPDGSGQGLTVVRELAIAAGGTVLAERRPGGACFEIWMPARRIEPVV